MNNLRLRLVALSGFVAGSFLTACSDGRKSAEQYPVEVEDILHTSCAGSACHVGSDQHDLGAGLDLSSWETLFEGSHYGAVVIPFSSKFSHLVRHLTGEQLLMPPGGPLPQDEIDIIRQWIDNGAPSRDGTVAFADRTSRIFTTNQDSDVVSVIDAANLLAIRTFQIGVSPSFESPHGIQVSPDGRYFYTSMIVGQAVLKYDASNGQFMDSVNLGKPPALIQLSSDGSRLYVATNFDINNPAATAGQVTVIRTADMQVLSQIPIGVNPHGITLSRDGIFMYVATVASDRIYVVDTRSDTLLSSFEVAADPGPNADFEPYHVAVGPANANGYEDYLFLACRKDSKVRIFQRVSTAGQHSFTPVSDVPVGFRPVQAAATGDGQKIYCVNYGDNSVSVIRRSGSSFALEKTLSTTIVGDDTLRLAGPSGVAISRDGNFVYVANRNRTGIAGHHGGTGGGFLSVIDVLTDELIKTIELPPDAYSVVVTP